MLPVIEPVPVKRQTLSEVFDALGVKVEHHFDADAVERVHPVMSGLGRPLPKLPEGHHWYAKETNIPAGVTLTQHAHEFDHLSILESGTVMVGNGSGFRLETAPAVMVIPAGIYHSVQALVPAVWLCVHATDETTAEAVDAALLKGGK